MDKFIAQISKLSLRLALIISISLFGEAKHYSFVELRSLKKLKDKLFIFYKQ